MTDDIAIRPRARPLIEGLLAGEEPNGVDPGELGHFGEIYREVARALGQGGREAARRAWVGFCEHDPAAAALLAADEERQRFYSMAELLTKPFPPVPWIVPDMLTVGLTILAGKSKLGKSWLGLQLAVATGTGGMFLGHQVEQRPVLYLALEDDPQSMQERLKVQKAPVEHGAMFAFEWPYLVDGGIAELMTHIDRDNYQMVIVDTLSVALGRSDQMDLTDMTVTMSSLHRLALDRGVALVLVDHHNKGAGRYGDDDVVTDVMGSSGKGAVADCIWGLYRKRGDANATLKIDGRRVRYSASSLNFAHDICTWQLVGDADGVRRDSVQSDILQALEELGGTATTAKVAQWLNKQPANISVELAELVAKGRVTRGERNGREIPYTLVESS